MCERRTDGLTDKQLIASGTCAGAEGGVELPADEWLDDDDYEMSETDKEANSLPAAAGDCGPTPNRRRPRAAVHPAAAELYQLHDDYHRPNVSTTPMPLPPRSTAAPRNKIILQGSSVVTRVKCLPIFMVVLKFLAKTPRTWPNSTSEITKTSSS